MAISSNGAKLFVAAFGSSKVGIFDTAALEADTFIPNSKNHIVLSGGGPSGLALDEARQKLYVLTRFNNSVSVVDLKTNHEVASIAMYNPEPPEVTNGRRFLYDAAYTSSRGDSSCAGCHIFGDTDHLSWDLGNPDGLVQPNPNPTNISDPPLAEFHPMKGPMVTQSMRGMENQGPMHWRGDRTGGNKLGGEPLDEEAAFKAFNVAFEGLIGRTAPLSDNEMSAFTKFALKITYPPNPIRALNNKLNVSETKGADIYFNRPGIRELKCNDCHTLDPEQGFFGTQGLSGLTSLDDDSLQSIKEPQFRNLYTKIGLFYPDLKSSKPRIGAQIRGFGYTHDGVVDTLLNFLTAPSFTQFSDGIEGDKDREHVANFLLAYPSNLAPIVGQQVTIGEKSSDRDLQRMWLLRARALSGECELVVKGVIQGIERGMLMRSNGLFDLDRISETPLSIFQLGSLIHTHNEPLTLTCVPLGSGTRIGLDRDEDGALDRDELDAGSNPADPSSHF